MRFGSLPISRLEGKPPRPPFWQTFGICYDPDDTCRSRRKDGNPRVTRPLDYYRFKVWLRDRDKPKGDAPPAPTAPTAG